MRIESSSALGDGRLAECRKRSVEGKAIANALPISAFVALGFEHCIANFYFLSVC